MMPEAEMYRLMLAVAAAQDEAGAGRAEVGHQALLNGLEQARKAQEAGRPDASEVVRGWQESRDWFAKEHGIPPL